MDDVASFSFPEAALLLVSTKNRDVAILGADKRSAASGDENDVACEFACAVRMRRNN